MGAQYHPEHPGGRGKPQHHRIRSAGRAGASLVALALVALLTACASGPGPSASATSTPSTSAAPTATPTAPITVTGTTGTGGYAVKVYFAQHPTSDNDPGKVFAVNRVSPTLGVATYAIQQLLAGPTAAEQGAGYYTPWADALTGASNCGGADFSIALDHRGSVAAPGVATLQFCRTTQIAGELAGARMSATAQATLLQFSNIHSVVILNSTGHCFDDLSGQNACLNG